MMNDGIRIKDKHSYRDFGLYLKSRNVTLPEKKSIRETVPYFNGYYDFSALNGAPAWDARTVSYSFDVVGDNPVDLENQTVRILDWLCNVHDEPIFDDAMPLHYWKGSYDGCTLSWDESGDQVEIAVTFICHPFRIAREITEYKLEPGKEYIINNLGMAVTPTVTSTKGAAIQIGSYVNSIPAGEPYKLKINLERGENTVMVTGESSVMLGFFEELI